MTGEPTRDAQLRAGDRDRDSVAEFLRTQHAEGRIDTDELQQRIDRCYDAKTLGELDRLLVDLPHDLPARRDPAGAPERWRPRVLWVLPLIIVLAAISATTGHHVIWLAVPIIIVVTRVARRGRIRSAPLRAR